MRIKDAFILALGAVAIIEFVMLQQGCGRSPLGIDCPEPKVVTREVKVEGRSNPERPMTKPRETVQPMPILKPVLVAMYADGPVYVNPTDTATIVSDWAIRREYTEDVSDTNLTATINAIVQFNRLQDVSLQYEFVKEEHTTLYDRFQMHTVGAVGTASNFRDRSYVKLGGGLLMEFKTGTGVGGIYQYRIGAPDPHDVNVLVTQRISFRRRGKK